MANLIQSFSVLALEYPLQSLIIVISYSKYSM